MARWLALLCTLAAAQQCPGADDDALTLSTKSRAELDQLRACVLGTTAIDRTVTRILLAGTDAALTDARVVKLDASLPVKQRAQFFAAARVVVGAGAALADIVYCAPGTSVVAVGAWAHHERLARTLGLTYASVAAGTEVGRGRDRRGQPFWRDRGPDVAALRRAVDAALGGRRLQQQTWAPVTIDDRSPCEARVHAVVVGDEDAPAAAILSYRAWQWRHAVFTTVATGISKDHFHDAVLKAEGPFASPWAAGHRTGPSSRADFFDHLVKAVVNKDGCQAGNRSRHEAHHARYLEALAAAAPRNADSDWAFVVDARAHVRPKLLGKLVAAAARFGDPIKERIRVGRRLASAQKSNSRHAIDATPALPTHRLICAQAHAAPRRRPRALPLVVQAAGRARRGLPGQGRFACVAGSIGGHRLAEGAEGASLRRPAGPPRRRAARAGLRPQLRDLRDGARARRRQGPVAHVHVGRGGPRGRVRGPGPLGRGPRHRGGVLGHPFLRAVRGRALDEGRQAHPCRRRDNRGALRRRDERVVVGAAVRGAGDLSVRITLS